MANELLAAALADDPLIGVMPDEDKDELVNATSFTSEYLAQLQNTTIYAGLSGDDPYEVNSYTDAINEELYGTPNQETALANNKKASEAAKITLTEKIKNFTIFDALEKIPFSPFFGLKKGLVAATKKKLETGKFPVTSFAGLSLRFGELVGLLDVTKEQQKKLVEHYEKEFRRPQTIPATIFDGVTMLPAYMIEFSTGGVAAKAIGLPIKGIKGAFAASTVRTLIQPHRVASAFIDQEAKGETPAMALFKAYGDVYIENISEAAGEGFIPLVKKLPLGSKLIGALVRIGEKLHIPKSEILNRIATKGGWNGFVSEWGEERLGTELRAIFNVEDFGTGPNSSIPDRMAAGFLIDMTLNNQLAEAGVLAFPFATKMLASKMIGSEPIEIEPAPEEKAEVPPITETVPAPEAPAEAITKPKPTIAPTEAKAKAKVEGEVEAVEETVEICPRCTNYTLAAFGIRKSEAVISGLGVTDAFKKEGYKTTPIVPGIDIPEETTLGQFIKTHPTGDYYIATSQHAMALRDGKLTDFAEGTNRRKVVGAYEVTKLPAPPAKVEKKAEELEAPEEAKKAERVLDVEAAEEIEAELYIGSITPGMKKRLEEGGQFKAEDIKGFHKPTGGPFPTIREKFKMTRGEAEQYLEFLEEDLVRRLDENLINTENDLAKANADWGDIRNIREALGMEKVIRPFTVERTEKHKIKVIPNVKARIKEAIRPTIESKMTVGEVLSIVLKRAARFAKMAHVKGRQELRAQLRAKAKAKKRLNKALKTIQQKIPQTVDFFYREAIDALRGDIDLKGRAKRTEATISSRREFIKRATEEQRKDIPIKQIKQIGQKALNDITIEELEGVATSIEQLIKQGKLKRKLILKPELEQRQKDIQELTENTEKVKPSRKKAGPQAASITEKSLKDKVFDIVKPLTWRPSRLFDWLDGGKNFQGTWHRIFYDNVKGARANQIRSANTRKEAFNNKIKSLSVSLWDLSKMREVNGVRWSSQEMIGIYMASKNELSKMALNFGMEIEDADIKAIINAMTSKEIVIGDFLLEDYKVNYSRLRRSVIEQENRDMGKQENYSPIRREGVNYTTLASEFIDSVIHRDTIRRHTPAKGMTIQRENVPPSLQTKIRLDAINIWNEQIEKQERYIYIGPVVRHMNKIMANRNLRKVVAERFGEQVVEYISGQQGYISRVANPYVYKQFTDIEKISGRLRRNTAIAYLAYNIVTMGKQLPSAFLYLADAGPSHLMASAIEFATSPREMIKRTRDLDPELKNRSIERELEELKSTHNGNLLKQKLTEHGMEGIYFFDMVARTIGWNAVYQRAIAADKSEGEAIRLARNATLRTQPAAAAEDLAALYTTNEFVNWFTMFTNQLNQIYNITTYDIPSYLKNKQYGDAALQTFGMGIVALTIWVISNKKLPEDPEEFAEAISEQAINMIPLVGKPIMSARKGWDSGLPVFKAAKAVGIALNSLTDLELTRSDTKAIAEGIAVTTGIPYTAIKRGVQVIEEKQPSALLGGRRPEKRQGTGRRTRARR